MGRGESDERDESVVAVERARERGGGARQAKAQYGGKCNQSVCLPGAGKRRGAEEETRERARDEEADEDEIGTYLYPRASVFRRAGDRHVSAALSRGQIV
jgi:hypothetical protein